MHFNLSKTTRFKAVAAAIQMSLGLAVYQFPHEFNAATYDPLRPYFPYLAVALMTSGVLLLQWRRPLSTRWHKMCATLLAVPIAVLTGWMIWAGGWSGVLIYGLIAISLLLLPWLQDRPEQTGARSRDLLSVTIGIAMGLLSAILLVWPKAFETVLYEPVSHVLPLAAVLGIVGALALLSPLLASPWLSWLQALIGAALPGLLTYNWVSGGYWTGVMSWGALTVAILSEPLTRRMVGRIRLRLQERDYLALFTGLERTMERWTWLLAVLVVAVMALGGAAAFSRPNAAHLFVLAVSGYNAIVHRFLSRVGSPAFRVKSHLLFLALLGGVLHVSGGPAGHGYLTLLVVVPPMATQAFGLAAGRRHLGLAIAVVVGSEALGWWLGGGEDAMLLSGATAMQVVLLLVAANLGIRYANESRRQQQELEAALESLQQGEAERDRLVAILEATPDLVGMADTEGQVMYVNPAGRKMMGLPQTGPLGRHNIGLDHPAWALHVIENEAQPTAARDGVWRGETALLTRAGKEIPVLQTLIAHRSVPGGVAYYSTIIRDITEQKQLEAQLTYLAKHDDLTDLANRRYFQAALSHQLDKASDAEQRGTVLLLDLDGFKDVNDTFGHGAGDRLLQSLAFLLQNQVRDTDLVARLGGDEFAILLPSTTRVQAEEVAQRILEAISGHALVLDGRPVRGTASIGIACYPKHGATVDKLLANADGALYEAKEQSRNTYVVYDPSESWQDQANARLVWEERLRHALEQDRFVLECQPVIALDTGKVCQFELLLRLLGDSGELIPPAEFIGRAESLGLIHQIDRWVVRRAIHLLANRPEIETGVAAAVNLSAKAFTDPELLSLIVGEFDRTGADPRCMIFEITETAAIADICQARRFIDKLSQLGCRFAIDDFGTGFSSYTLLRQLPVHFLKIDRSLISTITTDEADLEFVRAMTSIAHRLGQRVVAEGVSDGNTMRLLKSLHVDFAQGFYLGRPRPISGGQACLGAAELALN